MGHWNNTSGYKAQRRVSWGTGATRAPPDTLTTEATLLIRSPTLSKRPAGFGRLPGPTKGGQSRGTALVLACRLDLPLLPGPPLASVPVLKPGAPAPSLPRARFPPRGARLTPSTLATSRLSFSSRRSRARIACCRLGSGSPVFLRTASSCRVRSGRGQRPASTQQSHGGHRDLQPRPLPPPSSRRGRSSVSGHPQAPQSPPSCPQTDPSASVPFQKGPQPPPCRPRTPPCTTRHEGPPRKTSCKTRPNPPWHPSPGPRVTPPASRPSSGPRRAGGSLTLSSGSLSAPALGTPPGSAIRCPEGRPPARRGRRALEMWPVHPWEVDFKFYLS